MIVVKCGFYDLRNVLRYFDENFYRIISHIEATRKLLSVHNKTTTYFCQMLPFHIEISSLLITEIHVNANLFLDKV